MVDFGTIILITAIRLPLPPFPSLYPLPFIVILSPLCIPFGIAISSSSSIPSTLTLVLRADSHGVINKSVYKSTPCNLKFGLSFIFTFINRSPFFPPFFPCFP